MRYAFKLTPEILADFNRTHWFRFFLRKRYFFATGILLLFLFVNILMSDTPNVLFFYVFIFLFLVFGVYWLIYRLTLRKSFKSDPTLTAEREIEVKESGVRITTTDSDAVFKWSRVSRFVEAGKSYLLYIGMMRVIIVPKSVFKTTEERDHFEQYVKEKIKKRGEPILKKDE